MTPNALAELEPDALTAKRAQYEGFEFTLDAPGLVTVRNGSYGNDADDNTYRVNVEDGVPVACDCPAVIHRSSACKHRIAVAIRTPVLWAADGTGGESTDPDVFTPDERREVTTDGGDARDDDCQCLPSFDDLPCWPCYHDGVTEPDRRRRMRVNQRPARLRK